MTTLSDEEYLVLRAICDPRHQLTQADAFEMRNMYIPRLLDTIEALKAQVAATRLELQNVLASASPNERDHPAMAAAWLRANVFLAARPATTSAAVSPVGTVSFRDGKRVTE